MKNECVEYMSHESGEYFACHSHNFWNRLQTMSLEWSVIFFAAYPYEKKLMFYNNILLLIITVETIRLNRLKSQFWKIKYSTKKNAQVSMLKLVKSWKQ